MFIKDLKIWKAFEALLNQLFKLNVNKFDYKYSKSNKILIIYFRQFDQQNLRNRNMPYRLFPIIAVPESEVGHAYPKRSEMTTSKIEFTNEDIK